jgi:hypothetical protein
VEVTSLAIHSVGLELHAGKEIQRSLVSVDPWVTPEKDFIKVSKHENRTSRAREIYRSHLKFGHQTEKILVYATAFSANKISKIFESTKQTSGSFSAVLS